MRQKILNYLLLCLMHPYFGNKIPSLPDSKSPFIFFFRTTFGDSSNLNDWKSIVFAIVMLKPHVFARVIQIPHVLDKTESPARETELGDNRSSPVPEKSTETSTFERVSPLGTYQKLSIPTRVTTPTNTSSLWSRDLLTDLHMVLPELDLSASTPTPSTSSLMEGKLAKFQEYLARPMIDLEILRQLAWSGIPREIRAFVWKILMGYLPCNADRREITLYRKRSEYKEFVSQYFGMDKNYPDRKAYQQVSSFYVKKNAEPRYGSMFPNFPSCRFTLIFHGLRLSLTFCNIPSSIM